MQLLCVENRQWFEERQQQLETLESQLRRLQASLDGLHSHRRELACATAALGRGLALLSNGEDHAGLSRALAKMAELQDKVFHPFSHLVKSDLFILKVVVLVLAFYRSTSRVAYQSLLFMINRT